MMESTMRKIEATAMKDERTTGVVVFLRCKTKDNFYYVLERYDYKYKSHEEFMKGLGHVCSRARGSLNAFFEWLNTSGTTDFWNSAYEDILLRKSEITQVKLDLDHFYYEEASELTAPSL